MAPWSAKIIEQFSTIPPNPRENDFFGPYNKLLSTLFPPVSYTVAPRPHSSLNYVLGSYGVADFSIGFEVLLEDKTIFFMEIKEPQMLAFKSAREEADSHMRMRMADFGPDYPLDPLNGVSAFGTHLAFYSLDKQNRIHPNYIRSHDHGKETDVAPVDRWNSDILEDEGSQRFQDLVAEIKAKCNQPYEKC